MFGTFIHSLENLATLIPLSLFVFIGSFLEEIVAPIPSPLIMSSAGTIIQVQERSLIYILYIALIGAIGKTIASVLLYFFSDKIEDFLVKWFGSYFQITSKDTEGFGKYLHQRHRDGLVLFVLRAIPFFPQWTNLDCLWRDQAPSSHLYLGNNTWYGRQKFDLHLCHHLGVGLLGSFPVGLSNS